MLVRRRIAQRPPCGAVSHGADQVQRPLAVRALGMRPHPQGLRGRWLGVALVGALALSCGDEGSWVGAGGSPGPGPDEVLVQSGDGTAYYIDRFEVTRKAYAAWLATNPYPGGQSAACAENDDLTPTCRWPPDDKEHHPVVCVDWCDALAYCRAFGKRLCGKIGGGANDYHDYRDPDLDQWYNACSAGGPNEYPYGTPFEPHTCNGGLHGRGTTAPVGSLPECRTDSGLLDMSGNIAEWKDACETDATSVAFNYCRLGGGTFRSGELRHLSCDSPGQDAFRTGHWDSIGFRCCRDTSDANPAGTGGNSGVGGASADGCNDCLGSSCGTQDDACLANEDCILIVDCVGRCFTSECVAECEGEHPAGVDDFRALFACFEDSCAAVCD